MVNDPMVSNEDFLNEINRLVRSRHQVASAAPCLGRGTSWKIEKPRDEVVPASYTLW